MEKQNQQEFNELLENFENDVSSAFEIVKIDPTVQFVFEDFESWDSLKDNQLEIQKVITSIFGSDLKIVKEEELESEIGKIKTQLLQGDDEEVFLVKYKYEDHTVTFAIRGTEYIE